MILACYMATDIIIFKENLNFIQIRATNAASERYTECCIYICAASAAAGVHDLRVTIASAAAGVHDPRVAIASAAAGWQMLRATLTIHSCVECERLFI